MIPEAEQRRAIALLAASMAYQHNGPPRLPGTPGSTLTEPRVVAKYVIPLATAYEAWIASAVNESPTSPGAS